MQQLFHVSAFCYEKQKTDQHPRCLFEVLDTQPEVQHGRDLDMNLPPSSQVPQVHQLLRDGLSSLQNHAAVLNNLLHQVPVRDLKTYAFVQSRPSDPERGA